MDVPPTLPAGPVRPVPYPVPPTRRDTDPPHHVTFRLSGSLPIGALGRLRGDRDAAAGRRAGRASDAVVFARRVEQLLDAGHGTCWLRDPRLARAMVSALRFFDGRRYDLGPWVVMPNHVHAIVRPLPGHSLDGIVRSWTGFTALEAFRILGTAAEPFWAPEHLEWPILDVDGHVRWSEEIRCDPVKAGLCRAPEEWPWSSAHPRWTA